MTSAPPPPLPSRLGYARKVLGTLAATFFIFAFTTLLVECAYRYYLSTKVAAEVAVWSSKFKPTERPSFAAYGIAPWTFDKQIGFSYQPGLWRSATVDAGEFVKCG